MNTTILEKNYANDLIKVMIDDAAPKEPIEDYLQRMGKDSVSDALKIIITAGTNVFNTIIEEVKRIAAQAVFEELMAEVDFTTNPYEDDCRSPATSCFKGVTCTIRAMDVEQAKEYLEYVDKCYDYGKRIERVRVKAYFGTMVEDADIKKYVANFIVGQMESLFPLVIKECFEQVEENPEDLYTPKQLRKIYEKVFRDYVYKIDIEPNLANEKIKQIEDLEKIKRVAERGIGILYGDEKL